ncbi:5-methyltetrahydrofolate--homocysteine methyltransferase [Phorcysia thermohydrogeniphila]|uniref:Methionine synthase n=2 Tax=Phorcysia thermohydrogeniphila TaxID=936138 RepID=A0A4R1GHZ7_9BACT|nr:homocysteine S-methyltransferase family protein [Phorcysia thermohydrogeniphila]TCK06690.1 5-methyltetrahydrofolate--homocysteine methyltransferase [Phorcysia thermohydrogeniphila]
MNENPFKDSEKIWVLDGGMGTMLMKKGLDVNFAPELLNVERPEVLIEIHREYVEAGADIIETNTFGSNRIKLSHYGLEDRVKELTAAGVKLAKEAAAGRALVALSVGPTGVFVEPVGDYTFDEMVEIFKEQIEAGAEAGADLILIETMSDTKEAKAAVVAAREVCDLPVMVSMTYQEDGRTLLGTPPEVAAAIFEGFDVAAVGANCSLGPESFVEIVRKMAEVTETPIIVYANAGLPVLRDGKTIYPEPPETFEKVAVELIKAGANIIGGCCGTTPEHIRAIKRAVKNLKPAKRNPVRGVKVASRTELVFIGSDHPTRIIGERINPTGKKKLQEALKKGDFSLVKEEAKKQVEEGAEILDVNVGVPGIDEAEAMEKAVKIVMETVTVPIMIDSKNPEAIERALKMCDGRPIVNSCSGEEKDIKEILPLVKKYGANVLALGIDDEGLKEKAEDRVAVIERIINECEKVGIRRDAVIADVLNLAASAMQEATVETLKAIRLVKEKFGVATTLGVSNVSFGLPARSLINSAFMAMAIEAGLDSGIVNPGDSRMVETIYASDVLVGKDRGATRYVEKFTGYKPKAEDRECRELLKKICTLTCSFLEGKKVSVEVGGEERKKEEKGEKAEEEGAPEGVLGEIFKKVIEGDKEGILKPTEEALKSYEPMEISDRALISALDVVGKRFEKGEIFLPQMLRSAQAVQAAFEILKKEMKKKGKNLKTSGKIVMATVYGDVHEIGKNIVITMLENSGFEVVDLGTNVPPEKVVEAVKREKADLVGLSALMTTTLPAMEDTIKALREAGLDIPVIVGGAVVTPEYAEKIGGHYGGDAQEAVKIVKKLLGIED